MNRRGFLRGILIGSGAATAASLIGMGPLIRIASKEIWTPKLIPITTQSQFYEYFSGNKMVIQLDPLKPLTLEGIWHSYEPPDFRQENIDLCRRYFAEFAYGKNRNLFEKV